MKKGVQGKIDVVMGISWGDEAKVAIADAISDKYKYTARYSGSNNCGGTAYWNGKKIVLNLIPAGILQGKVSIIGHGVLVNPVALVKEIEMLEEAGLTDVRKLIVLSDRAFLTLPQHITLDNMSENSLGEKKIGTTGKGVTPSAASRLMREGLRIGDIKREDFYSMYHALGEKLLSVPTPLKETNEFLDACETLSFDVTILDTIYLVHEILAQGESILCNGNQGTMLDFMFTPTYPYCSSTGNTIGSVCTGLGVSHLDIGTIYGVGKFYTTRVGSGHFTGCLDETIEGKHIQEVGHEFGAVTGRPRSVSWINLPELKYACMVNGVTELCLTKADVITGLKQVGLITGYMENGYVRKEMPLNITEELEPVIEMMPAWGDVSTCRTVEDFPIELTNFINKVQKYVGANITYVSNGVEREATVNI